MNEGRWRGRGPATGDMTPLLAGVSGGVAGGLMESGGAGVALPCASARRSRLLPEVLTTARMFGASSLLVTGQSSGT